MSPLLSPPPSGPFTNLPLCPFFMPSCTGAPFLLFYMPSSLWYHPLHTFFSGVPSPPVPQVVPVPTSHPHCLRAPHSPAPISASTQNASPRGLPSPQETLPEHLCVPLPPALQHPGSAWGPHTALANLLPPPNHPLMSWSPGLLWLLQGLQHPPKPLLHFRTIPFSTLPSTFPFLLLSWIQVNWVATQELTCRALSPREVLLVTVLRVWDTGMLPPPQPSCLPHTARSTSTPLPCCPPLSPSLCCPLPALDTSCHPAAPHDATSTCLFLSHAHSSDPIISRETLLPVSEHHTWLSQN